jgi:dienelactone hydrolase
MKSSKDPTSANKYDNRRRNFLKTQLVAGIGASVLGISEAFSASGPPAGPSSSPADRMRQSYLDCLGGPFPDPIPSKTIVSGVVQKEGYRIESLTYEAQPGIRIPALLLVPDQVNKEHRAPGIAVWHQHNGEYHLGKSEPAGLAGNQMHFTGVALVKEGYVVLCPDALCFEERQDPTGKLKEGSYERFEFLREVVRGRSMAWRNVLEMKKAVDVLCERPEVMSDRIGCYGHSMGSTHCWLVGPLEPRLKCVVGNCCLPTYDGIEATHITHCFPNFVPGWKKYGDTPEIAALIAPRALHLNFGDKDKGSPIEFVKQGIQRIADTYREAGVPENFTHFIEPETGHVLTDQMWEHAKKCFEKHLKLS